MFIDLPHTDKQLEIRINGQDRPIALEEFMLTTSLLFFYSVATDVFVSPIS